MGPGRVNPNPSSVPRLPLRLCRNPRVASRPFDPNLLPCSPLRGSYLPQPKESVHPPQICPVQHPVYQPIRIHLMRATYLPLQTVVVRPLRRRGPVDRSSRSDHQVKRSIGYVVLRVERRLRAMGSPCPGMVLRSRWIHPTWKRVLTLRPMRLRTPSRKKDWIRIWSVLPSKLPT